MTDYWCYMYQHGLPGYFLTDHFIMCVCVGECMGGSERESGEAMMSKEA